MGFLENARANILPLSVSDNFNDALKEWEYTGNIEDTHDIEEMCQLCNKEGLRYQFLIYNKLTGNHLEVGSVCILNFDIAVLSEYGTVLDGSRAKKKLDADKRKFIKNKQHNLVIEKIKEIANSDSWFSSVAKSFIDDYDNRGGFTPKQLLTVIKIAIKRHVNIKNSAFKITLKRDSHKSQLRSMSVEELNLVLPFLSSQQRKTYC